MAWNGRYDDAVPVDEVDDGMGDTVGMLKSDLLDDIEGLAEELGVDLPDDEDSYRFSYSDENRRVTVHTESYGGALVPVAEQTAFLVDDRDHEPAAHQNPNGPEIRLGNDDIEVEEGNLRVSADYFEQNAS
ncbi:MAG: hypothetical protein ABEK16_06575 [Candidatus Nanohalobium sp.]